MTAKATRVEHVEALVVGSGFGGSVAAYRLAEAGKSTVLLERGQAYPPGTFARNPYEMSRSFWEPKDELFGLFDVRSFRKLEAIVSSGLGGGSLIYANVLLRKDEKWFVHDSPLPGGGYENWPIGREDLEPHYDAVEKMIHPTPSPYPDIPKARALREAAQALGLEVFHPPLAIDFASSPGAAAGPKQVIETPYYGNLHNVTRLSCRLCGECDIGCNEGSKSTLDHNYLSAASFHGADLRTSCEVTSIVPLREGGYAVGYVRYEPDSDAEGHRVRSRHKIHCNQLFLAAGALGTTSLLLRNRVNLPLLSRALGTRFCGNGDLLTFAMGAQSDTSTHHPRVIDGSYGPVITTSIRVPDSVDGTGREGRGYYVQEAGFPEFANWLIETAQVTSSLQRAAKIARDLLLYRLRGLNESTISAEVAQAIGHGRLGASSLPLLGMGRDVADGRVVLSDGELDVIWSTFTSTKYFAEMRGTMRELSDTLHADFHDNPLWWTNRVVTVHPLGGAPMGRSAHEGLVDRWGEVFGYPGLYVVDGASMPGPVGPNPALTIAAVADRAVQHTLDQPTSWRATDLDEEEDEVTDQGPTEGRSVAFTEQMKGYLALGETDPMAGWRTARQLNHRFMFELTITVPDVERFIDAGDHPGTAEGFVRCDLLGGRLPVQRGWFNLFVETERADTREMRYRLWLRDLARAPITMVGFKTVRNDPGMDIWADTSTLYITLLKGHVLPGETGSVLGAGMLRILPGDFAKQVTTFRADGRGRVRAIGQFGAHFAKSLIHSYGMRPTSRRGEPT
ncbi:MAG: GMC family oxidoreductase [Micropruina sp.]